MESKQTETYGQYITLCVNEYTQFEDFIEDETKYRTFYDKGKRKITIPIDEQGNIADGHVITYRSGVKYSETQIRNGQKNGIEYWYSLTGFIEQKVEYKDGVPLKDIFYIDESTFVVMQKPGDSIWPKFY